VSDGDKTINPNEMAYLALLRDVAIDGTRVPTRAVLESTGERVEALSVFGRQVRYDLRAGFPLLTTKKVNFDAIVHELVWFLSGSTNIAYLREHGVHIWDQWAGEDGEVGPIYPAQWRSWQDYDGGDIDQIARLVCDIGRVRDDPEDPAARRLILSAWNVAELPAMALPPCHVLAQFHVSADHRLSCQFYQRSADLFLGVPWNIASYALLTHLLAHVTGLGIGDLIHSIGDAHIYTNHLDQVEEQLGRTPISPPVLWLDSAAIDDIDDFRREHARLVGYRCHPALRGEVAV
jgi:thymidylate synthase